MNGIYDKDPVTEEPDEANVSRPVREWRRGGRLPRRPYLARSWARHKVFTKLFQIFTTIYELVN